MRSVILAITAASALLANATLGRAADVEAPGDYYAAEPAPGVPYYGVPYAAQPLPDEIPVVENVQYVYDGYRYCWFPRGWRGPGWYVCDYGPWVEGYWWGGPPGWHGWRGGSRFFGGPRFRPGGPRGPGWSRSRARRPWSRSRRPRRARRPRAPLIIGGTWRSRAVGTRPRGAVASSHPHVCFDRRWSRTGCAVHADRQHALASWCCNMSGVRCRLTGHRKGRMG